ncbi:MAG: hypothetical protein O3A63_15540, partial [Proteobacteria bacterium]|nr:hypothetical protein [Pseudomonadota bacterium]
MTNLSIVSLPWTRRLTAFLAVCVCLSTHAELPPAVSTSEVIPAGSLIIAMDNNTQNIGSAFNLKSYGMVNHLLWNNIPVKWAIKPGKTKDGIDFTVAVQRVLPTSAAQSTISFHSGPFIVHRDLAALALPLMIAYGNNVAVYLTKADVTVDIRQTILQRKKVGVLDDGDKADIHTAILNEAGFVSGQQYVVIPAATLANINANVCITLASEPHWDVTDNDTEAQAIRLFVEAGGNFLAQCVAIVSYENNTLHGLYQTTNGVVKNKLSGGFSYPRADLQYSQFHGELKDKGGSISDYELNGGSFRNGAHAHVTNLSDPDTYVATASQLNSGGGAGVYYLGAHEYNGNDIAEINGRRMYLNAVMAYAARPTSCGFDFPASPLANLIVLKSVETINDPVGSSYPKSIPGAVIRYTIRVSNSGGGATDPNTETLVDSLPAAISMYMEDLGIDGSGPIYFEEGTSGLGFT